MDETEAAIAYRDEVSDRVEGIVQLTARSDDRLEQLHVLQGVGQLAAQLVRVVEQLGSSVARRLDAFEHERAECPPAASKRYDHEWWPVGRIIRRR